MAKTCLSSDQTCHFQFYMEYGQIISDSTVLALISSGKNKRPPKMKSTSVSLLSAKETAIVCTIDHLTKLLYTI